MRLKKGSGDSADKIKVAALHLFAIKGYYYTSLEEIAHSAGFTKGAIYYHFKSKKRLILEILDDIKSRSIDLSAQEVSLGGGTAKELLVQFYKSQSVWGAEHPDDIGVLIMMSVSFAHGDTEVHSKIEEIYARLTQVLTEIITFGVNQGEISLDVSIKDAVNSMIASHDGNMLQWYRSGRDAEVGRQLVKSLMNALLHPIVFD